MSGHTPTVRRYSSRILRAPPYFAASGSDSVRQTAKIWGCWKIPPDTNAATPCSKGTRSAGWQSHFSMQSGALRSSIPVHGESCDLAQYCSAQAAIDSFDGSFDCGTGASPYVSASTVTSANPSGPPVGCERVVSGVEVADVDPSEDGGGEVHPAEARWPQGKSRPAARWPWDHVSSRHIFRTRAAGRAEHSKPATPRIGGLPVSRGLNLAETREEHASTRGTNETVVLSAVSHLASASRRRRRFPIISTQQPRLSLAKSPSMPSSPKVSPVSQGTQRRD